MKLGILLYVCSFLAISGFDLTEVKLIFCEKLKGHWAYDRLLLKHTCLQMAKKLGSELCLDVTKIFLFLYINLSCVNVSNINFKNT